MVCVGILFLFCFFDMNSHVLDTHVLVKYCFSGIVELRISIWYPMAMMMMLMCCWIILFR